MRWPLPSLAVTLLLMGTLQAQSLPSESSELIYALGSAPFPASHASTVVQLKDGSLLSAWFGGTAEGKPDVAIWAAHQTPSGWSAPVELVREPNVPCWNPVLFHTADSRLWLYYKYGPSPSTWTGARIVSTDEGKTWSTPEHLPAGLLGPIRAKPLILPNGTIVSGTSVETYRSWAVWVDRSTDNGKTWTKFGPIVPPLTPDKPDQPGTGIQESAVKESRFTTGIIQPSVVSLGGKHLRLYARSTLLTGRVCVADSYDLGITWTQARPLEVPNPNSGIDAVTLRDGRVVLLYNNAPTGRTPLNLAVSADGEHFAMFRTLEDQPGEFSYPALIQVANGDLEMTYTYQRKSIKHVHLPLALVPKVKSNDTGHK